MTDESPTDARAGRRKNNPAVFSSASASSAIRPDGTLNVDLLSKGIARDLSDDARYRAEDSMKKRAVHESKDYDEFRSFVACSQLRPIQGSELSQLIKPGSGQSFRCTRVSKRTGGDARACVAEDMANSLPSANDGRKGKKKGARDRRLGRRRVADGEVGFPSAAPRTPSEFHRHWRVQCAGREDRERYIAGALLTPSKFEALFSRIALDPTLMGEILEVLEALVCRRVQGDEKVDTGHAPSEVMLLAFEWLRAITKCDRFSLNVAFLDSKHTNAVKAILNCVESECNQSADGTQTTPAQVSQLRQMYNVA